MLPKALRLPSAEIPLLARKGNRSGNQYLDIRTLPFDSTQYAISISVKVDKRAAVRNRIKRRIRVAIIHLAQEGKLPKGKHLIVVKSAELADNLAIEPMLAL